MEQIDWFAHESAARQRGFVQVCGIDEAGRGPLAGPVFAAAVLLPVGVQIEGLNDSKKLSEKKREQLFDVIQETAIMADRLAIDEELVRLTSHVAQLRALLCDPAPAGRRLDFLAQEFNREVNTIASKSQDIAITRLAMDGKAEIEKLREQVQNVE